MIVQILVTWLYLQNENPYLGRHFETADFLKLIIADYACHRFIQVWCKFGTEIPTRKVLNLAWVQVDPLWANGSEKSLAHLGVKEIMTFL